jgi:hypothetical protein
MLTSASTLDPGSDRNAEPVFGFQIQIAGDFCSAALENILQALKIILHFHFPGPEV